jgi:hypothetical protein
MFSIWEGPLLLSNNKQEVLGRSNRLLSFDMWNTQKMMRPTILLLLYVFVATINIFTKPLPSNDRRGTDTDTQTDGRDL